MISNITPQELKDKLEAKTEPVELVDVRSAEDFEEKHIPRAMNIPHGEGFVGAAQKALHDGHDLYIVVYSEHEEMGVAGKAAAELDAAGYTKVHHLTGGLMGWMEAGGTVEFGGSS